MKFLTIKSRTDGSTRNLLVCKNVSHQRLSQDQRLRLLTGLLTSKRVSNYLIAKAFVK